MKKQYENPKAEKMEFNYSETVVASISAGDTLNDTIQQYYSCTCSPYYAGGWGQNCSGQQPPQQPPQQQCRCWD